MVKGKGVIEEYGHTICKRTILIHENATLRS